MNELLPFGEYIPRSQQVADSTHYMLGLDPLELERLLQRLNLANGNSTGAQQGRRSRRHRSRGEALAVPGKGHVAVAL